MIYISHQLKAIYIHIPKCGGCYVRDILINCYGFQNICNKDKRRDYDKFFDYPEQITEEDNSVDSIRIFGILRYYLDNPHLDKQRVDAFKQYYIFSFIRNPYDKIVSGFLYVQQFVCSKYHKKESEKNTISMETLLDEDTEFCELHNIPTPVDLQEFESDIVEANDSDELRNILNDTKNITHEEMKSPKFKADVKKDRGGYLEKIKDNPEYYKNFITYVKNRENICNLSYFHSFVTQKQHLLNYDDKINIHYIGTTENLDNDLLNILAQLGVAEFKHMDYIYDNIKINQSKKKNNTIDYYDEETFIIVNELMNDDFETFKYKKYSNYSEFCSEFKKDKDEIKQKNNISLTNIYKEFKILNSNNEEIVKIEAEINDYFSKIFRNLELMLRISENNIFFHDSKNVILKLFNKKKELMTVSKKIDSGNELENKMIKGNDSMKKIKNKCNICEFFSYQDYAMECHKRSE